MPVHGAQQRAKIGIHLQEDGENFVAQMQLDRNVLADLLQLGRITILAKDLQIGGEVADRPVRYLTLDLSD
ncbi:hypothetical protein AB0D08_11390 [Kitasatospora sp. NPDC048540]|uniref:hypothetical protein n=1 Tax=unclassified Kitasatospora TaxID=2633591 RepID=UPI00053982A2|nr:hypothetical protein [Kitasatospora sp. MBT63]